MIKCYKTQKTAYYRADRRAESQQASDARWPQQHVQQGQSRLIKRCNKKTKWRAKCKTDSCLHVISYMRALSPINCQQTLFSRLSFSNALFFLNSFMNGAEKQETTEDIQRETMRTQKADRHKHASRMCHNNTELCLWHNVYSGWIFLPQNQSWN